MNVSLSYSLPPPPAPAPDRPYDPHSLIDVEEMDALDTHPSAKEAQEAQKKRQSVPIDNCFEKFTECEQLGTSELWYCSRCKTHRQVRLRLRLRLTLPCSSASQPRVLGVVAVATVQRYL